MSAVVQEPLDEPSLGLPDADKLSYKQLYHDAMQQVGSRKGLLLKRSAKVVAPSLILAGLFPFLAPEGNDTAKHAPTWYVVLLLITFAVSGIYSLIMRRIFHLEQVVWIDSFDHGKKMEPKESWNIAKQLLIPSVILRLRIVLRYWIPFLLLWVVLLFAAIWPISDNHHQWYIIATLVLVILSPFGFSFYLRHYKFRYLWYVYYDLSKQGKVSHKELYRELRMLNRQKRLDTFKKSFLSGFTIGAAEFGTSLATTSAAAVAGSGGTVGRSVAGVSATYADEVIKETGSYAKVIVNYIIYKYAKKLSGQADSDKPVQ